jgi:glycosyltransferase involved in cell wall biosynthesis
MISFLLPCVRTSVKTTLSSVLGQTRSLPFEILIMLNDRDREKEIRKIIDIFKTLMELRIFKTNQLSQGELMMFGTNEARGEIIGFLFDDDWVFPNYLADLSQAFDDPWTEGAFGRVLNWQGDRIKRIYAEHGNPIELQKLAIDNEIPLQGLLVRKEIAKELAFLTNSVLYDWDFTGRLAKRNKLKFVPKIVAVWNQREDGLLMTTRRKFGAKRWAEEIKFIRRRIKNYSGI